MYSSKFQQQKLAQAMAELFAGLSTPPPPSHTHKDTHAHRYIYQQRYSSSNSFFISNSCVRTETITSLLTFNQGLSNRDLRAEFQRSPTGQRSPSDTHFQLELSCLVSQSVNQHSPTWLDGSRCCIIPWPQALLTSVHSDGHIISIDQSYLVKRIAERNPHQNRYFYLQLQSKL